jgi:hypothetical protein
VDAALQRTGPLNEVMKQRITERRFGFLLKEINILNKNYRE